LVQFRHGDKKAEVKRQNPYGVQGRARAKRAGEEVESSSSLSGSSSFMLDERDELEKLDELVPCALRAGVPHFPENDRRA
jgi:hypothetical protein